MEPTELPPAADTDTVITPAGLMPQIMRFMAKQPLGNAEAAGIWNALQMVRLAEPQPAARHLDPVNA